MARVILPQSKLRRRRRTRRALLWVCAALLVAAALGGMAWLAQASFLEIGTISVHGSKTLPTSTIEALVRERLAGSYAGLFPRDNIFIYPRAAITKDLLVEFPELRAADVHATDFRSIAVELGEREPVALWCGEGCHYMDESGVVYRPAPQFSEPVYVEYRGAATSTENPKLLQYLSGSQFQSLSALVAAFSEKIKDDPIRTVAVDSLGDARVGLRSGFVLLFALAEDSGDVFERFSLALDSDALKGKKFSQFEYLDLRFGDKLYYKAK